MCFRISGIFEILGTTVPIEAIWIQWQDCYRESWLHFD